MKTLLVFYGTGDEAYEQWRRMLELYHSLDGDRFATQTLRKGVLQWLKAAARQSRRDYAEFIGDPDDSNTDYVTVTL